jgi:hypothetical protein
MRGDLLIVGDAAAPAGVEEIAGAAMDVVIADIFDKMGGALADLGLAHDGCMQRLYNNA